MIENHIAPNPDTHAASFGPMSGSPYHKPEQCFKLRPHVVERAPGDIQLEIKWTTMAELNTWGKTWRCPRGSCGRWWAAPGRGPGRPAGWFSEEGRLRSTYVRKSSWVRVDFWNLSLYAGGSILNHDFVALGFISGVPADKAKAVKPVLKEKRSSSTSSKFLHVLNR